MLMNPHHLHLELPSLSYLKFLSNGNKNFAIKLLQILKDELPEELDSYNKALKSKNHFRAAEIVHKINHKIAFFQMEQSSLLATEHELALREGKLNYQEYFLGIVTKILKFIPEFIEEPHELHSR